MVIGSLLLVVDQKVKQFLAKSPDLAQKVQILQYKHKNFNKLYVYIIYIYYIYYIRYIIYYILLYYSITLTYHGIGNLLFILTNSYNVANNI